MEVQKDDRLLISYVGYAQEEIIVEEDSLLEVFMMTDAALLESVVVDNSKSDRKADQEAEPMMGKKAFKRYIKESLIYPVPAKEAGIKGSVELEFIIDSRGYASSFKVLKSLGYGCDEEAIRLIREGPIWKAARREGKAAASTVNYTIDFK